MLRYLVNTVAGLACLVSMASYAAADTLSDVRARGTLKCGVPPGFPGFASVDSAGKWNGMNIALCKAIAAAVLGDPEKIDAQPHNAKTRFTALSSGEVDLLSHGVTWNYQRDVDLKATFAGVFFYSGQGFLVKKSLNVGSAKELDGASICVAAGNTSEAHLADFTRKNKMSVTLVPIPDVFEGAKSYIANACDVITTDIVALASIRASFPNPEEHVILPDIIAKEPLSLVTRHGDDQWTDIVRWTLFALILAEEHGITSSNVEQLAADGSPDSEVNRLLGRNDDYGAMANLSRDWAVKAIKAVGNYGEVYDNSFGANTKIALPRGQNRLADDGGLLYSPGMN